jgi:hypothetical protein
MKERRKLHSNGYLSMQLLCHLNIYEYRGVHPGIWIWGVILLTCIFKYLNNNSKREGTLILVFQFLSYNGILGNILSIIWQLGKNFSVSITGKPFYLLLRNTDILNNISGLNYFRR